MVAEHRKAWHSMARQWPPEDISQEVPSGGHSPRGGPGRPRQPACKSMRKVPSGSIFPGGSPGRPRQRANLYEKCSLAAISRQATQEGPASIQICTYGALRRPFPTRWPRESRQHTNLYENCPPEAISQLVAQGSPANVQIYTESALQRPFPSKWPREATPACKSVRKVHSGGHFSAGGSGRPRQHVNLYEKCSPGPISRQVTQGGPASVLLIYTKSALRSAGPGRSCQRTNL